MIIITVPARLSGHSTIGPTHLLGQGNLCHVCSATTKQWTNL